MRRSTHSFLGGVLAVGLLSAGVVPATAAAAEPDAALLVATRSDRQGGVALDGAAFTTNQDLYVFADVDRSVAPSQVEFWVNGGRWQRDRSAPYDLLGSSGSRARGLNTRDLGKGTHEIRIVVVKPGDDLRVTARFTVGVAAPTTTAPAPTTTTTAPPATTTTTAPPATTTTTAPPATTTTTAPPATTTTTAPPATTTTTAPPTTTVPAPASRDAFLWPFSSTSPWNTPIGSGARFTAADAAITKNLIDTGVTPWVNAAQYSHPVVRARVSDPLVQVQWQYAIFAPWNNGTSTYRIPADAAPAAGIDAHLHVLDPDGRTLHETFEMRGTGASRTVQKYATFDLQGAGIGTVRGQNAGTRAYGGSALGGLIRTWELQRGEIRHALALTLTNGQLRDGYVWPATSQDTGGSTYAGQVPMGSLVGIPSQVDVDALGLTASGKVLARALQDYGAYVVDRGGAFTLYAEPSAEPALGDIRRDMAKIRSQLRVVENNTASSVGGGGTPRQPLAPSL